MINSFSPFFINQRHLTASQSFDQQKVSHEVISLQPKAKKCDNTVSQAHLATGKHPLSLSPHTLLSLEDSRLGKSDPAPNLISQRRKLRPRKVNGPAWGHRISGI